MQNFLYILAGVVGIGIAWKLFTLASSVIAFFVTLGVLVGDFADEM